MVARSWAFCVACVLILSGCSYQWQGFHTPATNSVLGDGSKTMSMGTVEQASLYAWLPYYVRSVLRDEINVRKLAQWRDDGESDYRMEVKVPLFRISSYSHDADDVTLLSAAQVQVELLVYHDKNDTLAWRSGIVNHTEYYENPREDQAVREVLEQALRRAVDRMQQAF